MNENETSLDRNAWRAHPGIRGPAGLLLSAHDSFRSAADALVEESNRDSPDWVSVVALFSRLDQALHGHHHAEEHGMFPRLRAAGIEVEALLNDHQALFTAIDDVRASFDNVSERTGDAIRSFASILRAHLEAEENAAVPYLLAHPWF